VRSNSDKLETKGTASAGALDLRIHPGLTHAPAQQGEGIRCQSNGIRVEDVVGAPEGPDLIAAAQAIAGRFGLSLEEVFDAIRYHQDNQDRHRS
jgi:hypothetical protein